MPTKSVGHADVEKFVDDLETNGNTVTSVSPHEGGVYVTWTVKRNRKPGVSETR